MNPTLTELCIEAQRELIEKHGYSPEDFSPVEGIETLYDGFGEPMDPHPLEGTPLHWYRRHAENAWSCMLARHLLEAIQPDIRSGTELLQVTI